ncbi:MAG: hypothetical protein WCK15_25375 [Pirellula sp.]
MKSIAPIDSVLPFAALKAESAQVQQINNRCFNPIEFDGIKSQAGLNSFVLTAKQWIERTGALFGQTAAQWRAANPKEKGSIRDQATGAQLVCLSNLENLNALFIGQALPQPALRPHRLLTTK